ncbi:MAG: hypothetical protein ABSH23_08805 [Steroidobacteraceae bacterium]|jgi:hypothetical protein
MTASMPPPHSASVSELLETAAQLFRATLLKCLPMAMLAVLCSQLANVYWIATGHAISFSARHDGNYALLSVLGAAFELWLISAMMLRQRAVALAAPVHAVAELRAAWQRLPSILGCALLGLLSVAVGLLLIGPGVFLLICYVVALPVVLFEGLTPYRALVRSVRLIRRLWWKTLASCVFALLGFVVCALVFAAIIGVLAGLLAGNGPAFQAIQSASSVALGALFFVFLSALVLAIHSAASSSA